MLDADIIRGAIEFSLMADRSGKRIGKELQFLCIEHDDHHPSARWNPNKLTWFCDVCGIGGGWVDLAKRLNLTSLTTPRLAHSHARQWKPKPYRWRDFSTALGFQALDFRVRSHAVLSAACGLDIRTWTDTDIDTALRVVSQAYRNMERADRLDELDFSLCSHGLTQEAHRASCR